MLRALSLKLSFVLLTAVLMLSNPTLSAVPVVEVVMSGLDNPRGLAFGPEGGLYVVEAGRGGTGPCQTLRMAVQCYGPSGAVTRLWRGVQERVVAGLPSQVDPTGQAFGAQDISFQGRGGAYITLGFGGDPSLRANFGPDGALFGTLIHASASGQWKVIVDVANYEVTDNPGGGPVDSNNYGVIAEPGGRVVSEAGGNVLLRVTANGTISTIAILPSRPQMRDTDAVPTGLTVGPDGAYYVGELTGGPFNAGSARIYRVVPGSPPVIYSEGFKAILDIAFGPDGSLYVVEFAGGATGLGAPGRLLRVLPNGTRETVLPELDRPTSVLVGADGIIYVTNHGTSPGNGEVLRVQP